MIWIILYAIFHCLIGLFFTWLYLRLLFNDEDRQVFVWWKYPVALSLVVFWPILVGGYFGVLAYINYLGINRE